MIWELLLCSPRSNLSRCHLLLDLIHQIQSLRFALGLRAKLTKSPAAPSALIYRSWVSKCHHQNQKKRFSSSKLIHSVYALKIYVKERIQLQHTCEVYVLFGLVYSWLPNESEYPGPGGRF